MAHLYAQLDGSIRQDKKYYNGLLERTAVYDYSSAEGMEDLIENGTEKLQELMGKKTMGMSVQEADLQIGDIIAGRDYETGVYLQKPVVQKIVKVENETLTIEYKVEGES